MEFEVLSEAAEWEARRVAAAFGVSEWQKKLSDHGRQYFEYVSAPNFVIDAVFVVKDSMLKSVHIRDDNDKCEAIFYGSLQSWRAYKSHLVPAFNELMARGLFRLGIDDPVALAELPPLTAHEKLELRLTMPREFWPQKWLDEEKAAQPETL